MNYRTNDRCNVPPVKGVLSGHQAVCECADMWGVKKLMQVSDERADVYHLEVPTDDGYKNIHIEAAELLDGLTKLSVEEFVRALSKTDKFREVLKALQEAI